MALRQPQEFLLRQQGGGLLQHVEQILRTQPPERSAQFVAIDLWLSHGLPHCLLCGSEGRRSVCAKAFDETWQSKPGDGLPFAGTCFGACHAIRGSAAGRARHPSAHPSEHPASQLPAQLPAQQPECAGFWIYAQVSGFLHFCAGSIAGRGRTGGRAGRVPQARSPGRGLALPGRATRRVTGGELGPAARFWGGGRAAGNGGGSRPERPQARTPGRDAGMVPGPTAIQPLEPAAIAIERRGGPRSGRFRRRLPWLPWARQRPGQPP